MAKKSDGLVADRPVLSLRPQADLKRRLEEAAGASGRSMAREAEVRLEASFESVSASKLERFIKNRPGLSYMIGMVTPVEFTNHLGEVLLNVVRHADDWGWSELQTREALAAATSVVSHYYFWRGAEMPPVPDVSPIPPADTKKRDLPPALAGYSIAEEQMMYSAALQDSPTYQATVDGKIANVWSGDGKQVEQVVPQAPDRKLSAKQRARLDASSGVLIGEEETARLHAEGKIKRADPHWHQVLVTREAERSLSK